MRITSTTGAISVQHDGVTYEAADDGVFDVPEPVGNDLTTFPQWLPEYEAQAIAAAEQAAADSDITRLAARVAELEAWRASLEDDTADDAEPKPKRAPRKPATS